MNKEQILHALQEEVKGFNEIIATDKGDWIVKGFIDIYKNIYTISIDTKVVSKVIELLLIPAFENFAIKYDLKLELPAQQNHYPDLTFICNKTGAKFAVDIKSTFIDSSNKIKSMTLGAFTGYFRNNNTKNISYPYDSYEAHLVLGVIYKQNKNEQNEKIVYKLDDIEKIESVIKDFQFFVQPKYKIASASPGSGNTKNIGATIKIDELINGKGIFSELGEDIYRDFWKYYLTKDMAKALEIERPYINLKTYLEYKQRGIDVLKEHQDQINQLNEEETNLDDEDDV